MSDLQIKAALAGIFFGLWPLFMNRSGLSGNVASVAFSAAALIGVLPFAVMSGGASLATASWLMVALAGAFGALGLLAFNGMLAGATSTSVSSLFVLMSVVQIAVPAAYQVIMTGELSLMRAAGFASAAVAAFLLVR